MERIEFIGEFDTCHVCDLSGVKNKVTDNMRFLSELLQELRFTWGLAVVLGMLNRLDERADFSINLGQVKKNVTKLRP